MHEYYDYARLGRILHHAIILANSKHKKEFTIDKQSPL